MKLSASQAAKTVGKSIPTITRAIKKGKLSASKLEGGGYEIEPSELYRVWPPITDERVSISKELPQEILPKSSALEGEVEALRKQVEFLEVERERERSQLSETIDDLRNRLDAENSERRSLTAQLTDQRAKPAEASKRSFLARFFRS